MGIRCLLCTGEMKLVMNEYESWLECQLNLTHRMTILEYSYLVRKERKKEQITEAMEKRRAILQAQLDENRRKTKEIKKKISTIV